MAEQAERELGEEAATAFDVDGVADGVAADRLPLAQLTRVDMAPPPKARMGDLLVVRRCRLTLSG